MTIRQSQTALRRNSPPRPLSAGMVAAAIFSYTFDKAFTAASDKIELGLLPAGAQPTRVRVLGENLGVITANVGIMTGEPGVADDARTVGTQFFAAVSVNNLETFCPLLATLAVAPAETHRAIGATLSADVAAGATKKLTLVVEYIY